MAIDDFRETAPLFVPETFFVGRLEGWAVVESLVGGLLKRATTSRQRIDDCGPSGVFTRLPFRALK